MKRYLVLSLVLALSSGSSLVAQSRDPAAQFTRKNQKFVDSFKTVIATPNQSTVRVLVDGKDAALGMVVGPDGWILTKANDLIGGVAVKLKDGKALPAQIVGVHQAHDLALLKIDAAGLKPVEFKEAGKTEVGSWVACAGPADEPVAIGVVSVASRNILNKGPIPKVDLSKAAYLGVGLEPGDGGAKVAQVQPNTPAQKIGLRNNDIIVAMEGKKVAGPDEFMALIAGYKPGDEVVLSVRRGDEILDRKVTLDRRPAGDNRGDIQNRMGSELSNRRSGYPTILQHDSVVKPTDCGGPIVDLEGRVIGINICRAGRTESWAVPAEIVQPILLDLMSGKLPPPKLDLSKVTPLDRVHYAQAAFDLAEYARKKAEQQFEEARKALQLAQEEQKIAEAKAKEAKAKETAKKTEKTESKKEESKKEEPKKVAPKIPDPQKEKIDSSSSAAADALVAAMRDRLALMNDVAAAKWSRKAPIHDPARESAMLADLVVRGKNLGLSEEAVKGFFATQIEASRARQEMLFAKWKSGEAGADSALDLEKDLRPRIDAINAKMLQSLAQLQPSLGDAAMRNQLRGRIAETLGNPALGDRAIDSLSKR